MRSLGVEAREVRLPSELSAVDALILPGGESTTMTLGIEREGLRGPIASFVASGAPVLATCAGAILLDSAHLGLLDIDCERNAYGSQVESFEAPVRLSRGGEFHGVFIRAPKISRVGSEVEVLARFGDDPVGVRAGAVRAYTFHPELTQDRSIHEEFISGEAA